MMLFWEALQCNKRFRSFIIDTDRVHDFVVLITYYALEYRLDPSKSGVVRMCVFVLQTLSTEPKFGKSLNKRFEGQSSLPASVRIPSFGGSYADYLIIVSSPSAPAPALPPSFSDRVLQSIYTLITTSKGKLSAVYPALLAIVANIAPRIQNLSSAASTKLIQLFASMSAPTFLLANEGNHQLLHSLLESMNAIIEHQYPGRWRPSCKPSKQKAVTAPLTHRLQKTPILFMRSSGSTGGSNRCGASRLSRGRRSWIVRTGCGKTGATTRPRCLSAC